MTTLTTFMLEIPSSAKSVNLVGSWDNFSKSYPMEKDPRRGRGHWRGCHTFENIICDGDLDGDSQKRDGALKMGGKYWYYYQMDQEVDFHNPAEPSTTRCPLLPGQPVNVLDMPVEISSKTSKSRSGSINSATFALDPNAKFMSPRPVPEPRSRSPSKAPASASIRQGRTFEAADERSVESSNSTLTRLMNKASIHDGLRSRSGSPSRSGNLRSAMSLSNLKGAHAHAHSDHDEARDRKRLFQKLQKSSDRGREISRPLPLGRSEGPRSIGPADLPQSAMSSRAASRATSRSASPAPSHDVVSLRSCATGETGGYSPLRTYLADRSWENSPMPPRSVGGFPDHLPPMSTTMSTASQPEEAKPREPSPLRTAQVHEENSVDILQEKIKEAEDIDDDFNFRFEFEPVASGSSSSSGLSAPPSRGQIDTAIVIPEAKDVPVPQAMTYMSPTFGSGPFVGNLPTSLHLQLAQPQPTRNAFTVLDSDEENFPKSRFSVWSNSTSAMSPMSEISDSPGSPCFSSLASESSVPLSPAYTSIHDQSLDFRPAEPVEFANTSFRSRSEFEPKSTEGAITDEAHTTEERAPAKDRIQTPGLASSTFQGYSLPDDKHGSQVTLRKPASGSLDKTQINGEFNGECKGKDVWEDEITSMDDMMRDLGYLGELIAHK